MVNFINPIKDSYLTSTFGWRTHPVTGKKQSWHQGIDLAIKPNTNVKVLASAAGEVIRVGALGTYGNIVIIKHNINGKHMETNYAHLKDKSITVKVGQKVKQGDVIGIMGSTGSSTAPHLHFEIHNGKWATGQPNAVNPLLFMNLKDNLATTTPKKVVNTKVKTLVLPKTASSWSVYPLNKAPVKVNAKGSLNPKKFGGLSYEILGNPQKDVYTINTSNFGKVNIYASTSTGAIIK